MDFRFCLRAHGRVNTFKVNSLSFIHTSKPFICHAVLRHGMTNLEKDGDFTSWESLRSVHFMGNDVNFELVIYQYFD
ncbi:hypothetical protein BH23BAC3_BH23BAC3_01970 [soil metagenome]